ncbi:MAG: SDR family NAD(P)-dependent oxidoreductase [Syntrophales bacterium]
MNWKEKKVFITGAGGFIGSHLTEALLQRGAHITALIHYNSRDNYGWLEELSGENHAALRVVLGDVRDSNTMHKLVADQNIIFHLAALIGIPYSYMAPAAYVETNIKGTLNMLQAGLEARVEKLVHTSTSEVYGTAIYTPIDEGHPLQGQSPYAASKIGADKLVESYCKSFSFPAVTVRPFNTFGPRQSARAVIPTIICQALKGTEVSLGSLDPVRDMTFVDDTVAGFIAAAETDHLAGETINLGTGRGVSIQELVDMIATLLKCEINITIDKERTRPSESEVLKLLSCADKAKRLMNWEAKTSLEDGLGKTVRWIADNLTTYKTRKFVY